MKKLSLILFILMSASLAAQNVEVYMEDYNIDNYNASLYWDARYGMKTMAHDWKQINDSTFTYKGHTITVHLFPDNWFEGTKQFIKAAQESSNTLFVLAGHNFVLGYPELIENTELKSPIMLFGCYTENWNQNAIVESHDYIAPEGYITVPAIQLWLDGMSDSVIIKKIIGNYSNYQKMNYESAEKIFSSGRID